VWDQHKFARQYRFMVVGAGAAAIVSFGAKSLAEIEVTRLVQEIARVCEGCDRNIVVLAVADFLEHNLLLPGGR
jgi:hypothetical protein